MDTNKKRFSQLVQVLFLGALLFQTSCASAPQKEGEEKTGTFPFFGSYQVHRFVLSNGLKLLVMEDHSSPTFAYQTWYNVGSRNETPQYTGLAHLFEHMMFRQTKNLAPGEFDRTLERAGTEGLNAYTTTDYTVYIQELPSTQLDLIARLESERMVNLIVDEKAFKTETEVVQNERRVRYENNPGGMMFQEMMAQAFQVHPYHWPVIGYQEDLDRMQASHAREFYQKHYTPNNAVIVVVGDVKASEVRDTVEKYYGGISPQPKAKEEFSAEPAQEGVRRKQLAFNMQVEKLLMAYHVPAVDHQDIATLELIQVLLTEGKSSRLNRALVEMGIAAGVGSGPYEQKDPSIFMIQADLQSGKKAPQAESVILRELASLAKKPVSKQELERSKTLYDFIFFKSLVGNSEKARFLGRGETLFNDYQKSMEQFHSRVQNVTADDIQVVAQKYFNQKNCTIIRGVPKGAPKS